MKNTTAAIPDGYHSITPYLVIAGNADEAIDFYKKIFGATENLRIGTPEGKVGHAELLIGTSRIMIADECHEQDIKAPRTTVHNPGMSLYLYIDDVDTVVKNAVAAGSKLIRPVDDKFYGDRSGTFVDPYGHTWTVATHTEDVPLSELKKRAETEGRVLKNVITHPESP